MPEGAPLDDIVANHFKSDEPTSLIQRFVCPDEVAFSDTLDEKEPSMGALAFSHIGITVPDLEKAVEFYWKAFGLYVIMGPAEIKHDDSAIELTYSADAYV